MVILPQPLSIILSQHRTTHTKPACTNVSTYTTLLATLQYKGRDIQTFR